MSARAACALCCFVLALPLANAQDAGVVEGSVVNSATRSGMAGVSVHLFTRQGVRYETTTDGTGRFSVHGMKEDEYDSSFDREGFAPPDSNRVMIRRRLLRVDGKNPARLDVELIPYAKIRGRVLDAEGKPAPDARVTLDGPLVGPNAEETTDNEGNFAFNKLLPGSYTVLARPKPVMPAKELADNRNEAVPTYFPSAVERAQAVPVVVRAGADASGNQIQLRSLPVYRVSGVVLDDAGKPAGKTTVSLHLRGAEPGNGGVSMMNLGGARTWFADLGLGPAVETTLTDGQGAFEFSSVREGDWLLRAESEWGYIEETKRDIQGVGKQRLSVSRKDVTDMKIRLITNFNLPLTVDIEDAAGATGPGLVNVMLEPVDGGPAVFGLRTKQNEDLIMDRTYPGEYRVIAQTFRPGFYVASVDYAGRPVSDQPVEIESGPQPLHIVLRNHAGQVRGVIEKGQAAAVLLLSGIVQGVESAAGALFQFDSLHPGAYEIVAFDHVEDAKLGDPAFVARLRTIAKSIRVEEGANASLELPVNRWPD
jgi:uncharacterized GH25 family protein